MTLLANLVGILAAAAVIAAFVLVGLRLFIPSEPRGDTTDKPPRQVRIRRRLRAAAGVVAAVAATNLALEIRFVYGAPHGDRSGLTVEVLEVGECHGATVLHLGLAQSCKLRSSQISDPELESFTQFGSIEVISGAPLQPGDEVAMYTASGWKNHLLLGASGTHWHPIETEGRPNLVWLPTAALIGAVLALYALDKGLRRKAIRGPITEPLT